MNVFISCVVGAALSMMSLLGGVSAIKGEPNGVPSDQLYTYSDK